MVQLRMTARISTVTEGLRLPCVEFGTTIPRIIHQTYPHSNMSDSLRRNVDELRGNNPNWDYRFYDDTRVEKFIDEYYGSRLLYYYSRINPDYGAARADLFRYLVMYRLGGVYLDVKSRFVRPIDDILRGDECFVLSRWNNGKGDQYEGFGLHPELANYPGGELQQWHIIAVRGHPFLKAVIKKVIENIERYNPWRNGVGQMGVLRLTGPIAYTIAVTPLFGVYPCKVFPDHRALGLEYSIFENLQHQNISQKHYTSATSSIVLLSGVSKWLGVGYGQGKKIPIWLRRCGSLIKRLLMKVL
jgi:inositol phosphorylceramide mannosyltransferase catalytic subunit